TRAAMKPGKLNCDTQLVSSRRKPKATCLPQFEVRAQASVIPSCVRRGTAPVGTSSGKASEMDNADASTWADKIWVEAAISPDGMFIGWPAIRCSGIDPNQTLDVLGM